MSGDNFLLIYKRKDATFSIHEINVNDRFSDVKTMTVANLEKDKHPINREPLKTFGEALACAKAREENYFVEHGTEIHESAKADAVAHKAPKPEPAPEPTPEPAPEVAAPPTPEAEPTPAPEPAPMEAAQA